MPRFFLGIFAFAILIAIFAVQNARPVAIRFFFWTIPEMPLVLVIFGTVLIGLVMGIFIGCYGKTKGKPPARPK
ncbi:MAG: lipopolysaccharide assembly protein [Thermacetogenium sp.]|nr:lipopolysaccharide assembly protein [Thermacetogenium sp.]MDN5376675.1 lipopolysaccharide assembly protein [Thermacetogenium sp.]